MAIARDDTVTMIDFDIAAEAAFPAGIFHLAGRNAANFMARSTGEIDTAMHRPIFVQGIPAFSVGARDIIMIDGRRQRQPANDLLKPVPMIDVAVQRGKRLIKLARFPFDSAERNKRPAAAGSFVSQARHQFFGFKTCPGNQPLQALDIAGGGLRDPAYQIAL